MLTGLRSSGEARLEWLILFQQVCRQGHGKEGHGKEGHRKQGHGKQGHRKQGHEKQGHGKQAWVLAQSWCNWLREENGLNSGLCHKGDWSLSGT